MDGHHCLIACCPNERKLISQRTKDALAPLKAKGKLENPCFKHGEQIPGSGGPVNAALATAAKKIKADAFALEIAAVIQELGGGSLRDIADGLNNSGFKTRRGQEWHATSVKRVLERVAASRAGVNSYSKG